jgi:cysteinyl-tRNA synthetase
MECPVALVLYDTARREKRLFTPITPGRVGMYVCGPTVYDYAHIGNARPVVVFDVLHRYFRSKGYDVTFVANVTDVDDKIIAAHEKTGEPMEALTERFASIYAEDMASLGALPPTVTPRATRHIPQMIAMIEKLIATGHAYQAEGHVLFNVPSMPDYGALSGRNRDDMIAGARVEVAPYKQDPADFVLWKPAGNHPGWDSPWGKGRPGWHIECSAMSEAYLGETFDIHGGGVDLIFPHHENEIAQSKCSHRGKPMANYWLHNGFLTVQSEKMSKSLGNITKVHEVLQNWPAEAARYLMLSAHYRAPLNWSEDGLEQAKRALDRLYLALQRLASVAPDEKAGESHVIRAVEDDLNTPEAFAALHELARDANKTESQIEQAELKAMLLAGGALLGVLQSDPEVWLRGAASTGGLSDASIERLIADRNAARKQRNFAESDRIRDELKANGVILEDGSSGTTWRRAG